MKFKGNNPIPETVHPDPQQQPSVFPKTPEELDERYSSIETANAAEEAEDAGETPELDRTYRDYKGRSEGEEEGAVPRELPEHDPALLHKLPRPGVPKHNM
jgi:hypothetical protein